MKSFMRGLALGAAVFVSASAQAEEQNVVLYLVDPQVAPTSNLDPLDLSDDGGITDPTTPSGPSPEAVAEAAAAAERARLAKKKLDDLIAEHQQEDRRLAEKRARLAKQVEAEQREFLALMDDFVRAPFNRSDDDAEPEFVKVRERITSLVFDAPTKRDYYERLFLINTVWNENQNEPERFRSLDDSLQDRSLALEARHRQIRTIIMGATTIVGLGLGGFLSYRASTKIIPIVANEGGFSSVAKVLGRGTIVVVGAGVGAAAGAYIGFLGSDALFRNERDFIDPIEGNEDLREILDYIDGLNTKFPI